MRSQSFFTLVIVVLAGQGLVGCGLGEQAEVASGCSAEVWDVAVLGSSAYLATPKGLCIVDVSDPAQPRETGLYRAKATAVTLSAPDTEPLYAYVTVNQQQIYALHVIDVSKPERPKKVGQYEGQWSRTSNIAAAGNLAYVAIDEYIDWGEVTFWAAGLSVVDVSDPEDPVEVAHYTEDNSEGTPVGVAVAKSYAYLLTDSGGLHVVSSDGQGVSFYGLQGREGKAGGVTIEGDYAYLATELGLRIVDISNPQNVRWAGRCEITGHGLDVSVAEGYVYLAAYDSGLRIIDVSDPEAPTEIGCYDTPGQAYNVTLAGGYAYLADGENGLCIIDVSNPAQPVLP